MRAENWDFVAGRGSCAQRLCLLVMVALLGLALGCGGSGGGSTMPAGLAGGGGSQTPPSGGTPGGSSGGTSGGTVSPATGPSASAFLFAGLGDAIWAGRIDSSNGHVTPLPTGRTDGASVVSLASDPQGRFLYTAQQAGSSGTTGIGVFAIDSATGALARGESIPLPNVPAAVVADRSGKAVYVFGDGAIGVFTVDTNGLTPVAGSPFPAALVGALAAITPDGRFLINVGGGQAAVFSLDPQTAKPTQISGSPFSTGAAGEQSVVISPGGKFLFILSAGAVNGNIVVMSIAGNGDLSLVPECVHTSPATVGCYLPPVLGVVSPRQGTSAVSSMAMDSLGHSLYVLAGDGNGSTRVVRLEVGLSGALGVISVLAQETAANSIALDSSGKFLFVGAGTGALFTYGTGTIPEAVASTTAGFAANANLVAVP